MTEQLTGQALHDRAVELDIAGRSSLSADELRAAIAEVEAAEVEVAANRDVLHPADTTEIRVAPLPPVTKN